jgi:hypothetical protein
MDPRASGRDLGSASPCGAGSRCDQLPRRTLAVLPQHPDQHRPKGPVLLAVDQEFGEGSVLGALLAALGVAFDPEATSFD